MSNEDFYQGVKRRTALLAAGMAVCTPTFLQAASNNFTLRLGQSLPLSGPHAVLADSYRSSAVAAFEEFNRSQGSGSGLRFKLHSLDDQNQPELTTANVMRLRAQKSVHALFGFVGEGADRAGAMAAAAIGVPYIAPVSGAMELRSSRRPGTFVFRASHADEIRYIAHHSEIIGLTRLALVYELTFMGLEMRNTMLDLVGADRRTEVTLTTIDTAGSAYTVPGAVATIMAVQPHAIVLGSNDVASAAFVKAVRIAGFKGYLYALSSVGSQGLAGRLDKLVSGISVTQVVPFPLSDSLIVSRNHRSFCSRNKIEPTLHTMEAWISATLLIEAIKRARGTQPTMIAEALVSAPAYNFGEYFAQWYESRPNPKAPVSLTYYDRDGQLKA